jgi:Tfp pilus assembly protein PilV
MRQALGKNNKAISLIESLVSIVIIGIGIISVLQLSVYAVRTADVALERNKVNFLSEMMMETLVANKSFKINTYQVDINTCSYDNYTDVRKIWVQSYRNVLDTNTKTTRCLTGDAKTATISDDFKNATINFIFGGGKQKRILGFSKIE